MSVQLPLQLRLRDSASLDNFYVADNTEALGQIMRLVQDAGRQFNLIYLWGANATGKTHLLQGVCHAVQEQGHTPVYIPLTEASDFAPQLLHDLSLADVVCLDDIQAVAGDRMWEEAVLALYEQRRSAGGKLLVAAASKPAQLDFALPDLRTRLEAGLVYGLRRLQDKDKAAALRWRAERRGLQLSNEVIHYIINHYPRDMALLFELLERLDQASLVEQRAITIPFIRQLL